MSTEYSKRVVVKGIIQLLIIYNSHVVKDFYVHSIDNYRNDENMRVLDKAKIRDLENFYDF